MNGALGHYRLLEQIGAGGMGVVYRARDERLQRDVAIKVLPEGLLTSVSARRRFRNEALALSQLNHPAVATIHDFDSQGGIDFLVLEYIEGQTLDKRLLAGPLDERETLRLGMQLASGLEAAHGHGVVHRDLKPGNLRVTRDGRLKILDFGLAQLLQPDSDRSQVATLTVTGNVVGTLPYMAPEQFDGRRVDARSDLHAAGAVLYEMVTGQRAFPQASAAEVMYAITHEPPPPPSDAGAHVSPGLEAVLLKALAKDPDHRYQSARELRADLERLAAPGHALLRRPRTARASALAAAGIALGVLVSLGAAWWFLASRPPSDAGPKGGASASLAVLPLENLSRNPQEDYFADGMTDELITSLGKISALRVIARGSVMEYKNTRKPLREIARALNVSTLLQGTVLHAGDRVRITAQLIQVASGKLLWSESYERSLRDVLALQNEVALAIATQIQVKLTPHDQKRLASRAQVDAEAHESYLQGQYYWNRSSPADKEKGVDFFRRAIARDSTYSRAYVGLADAYYALSNWWMPPSEALPKARAAALKALELDPDLADARALLGIIEAVYDWAPARAEAEFRTAIASGPNSAGAHMWYAYYLNQVGRFDESRAEYDRARGLDPRSSYVRFLSIWPDFYQRRYEAAESRLRDFIAEDSTFADAYTLLGETYEQQGRHAEALVQLRRAEARGTHAWTLAAIGRVLAESGQRDSALAMVAELERLSRREYVTPYGVATIFAGLGERDRAFEWLERAIRERCEDVLLIGIDPRMDRLRSDPRFEGVVRRTGSEPA